MDTVTVFLSIGRKAQATDYGEAGPLLPHDWEAFQSEFESLVLGRATTALAILNGLGFWADDTEQTYGLLVELTRDRLDVLRASTLPALARQYGQESIGCTIHNPAYGPSYVSAAS